MIHLTDSLIDDIIKEDMPFGDITTSMLGIDREKGSISFSARQEGVIAGSSVAGKIFKKLGAEVTMQIQEGSHISEGDLIFQARGSAAVLHAGWKISLNTLEYLSGIATFSKKMVEAAEKINPNVMLAATRKSLPLTRQLVTLAFQAGGVVPHRLGLSETILIFKHHLEFCDGFDNLENVIKSTKHKSYEKKIILETENYDDSIKALNFDFIDGIQMDKLAPDVVKSIVLKAKEIGKSKVIIAAGGINLSNIEAYAETGVDVIVSSSFFHAKPLDIKALIKKAE